MSNFNNKNPIWGKQHAMGTPTKPLMNQGAIGAVNAAGMVPFQQQQVFQSAMGLQQPNLSLGLQQMANNQINAAQIASSPLFQHVGAVSYPNPRALNPTAFQAPPMNPQMQNAPNQGTKQRVFTGVVTQVHDNFGFIDGEVFFPWNACVKGSNPMVGDKVLVEASFNSSMPFKWNASRVQVLVGISASQSLPAVKQNIFEDTSNGNDRFARNNRPKASVGGRGRDRSRDREREEDEADRKRRREERMREREKEERKSSPVRRRSRSPKSRRRQRMVPRYMVQIPKTALDLPEADVLEVKRRYGNLYIPSDFFTTRIRWVDAFPPGKPFALNKPCSFHVMSKEVEPPGENEAVWEPSDADYAFSAKVMLLSVPGLEELYQKCCGMAEDRDKRERESEDRDFIHPSRLISFLVGLRGKSETMTIGGPWSPSLDGENPQTDPSVLIKTAIRTCKALTGIDLSGCTQWYRFVELYYRRNESTHKGKQVAPRVETTVVYLPDVWSCLPTRLEWEGLQQAYRKRAERISKDHGGERRDVGGDDGGGGVATADADKEEEGVDQTGPSDVRGAKLTDVDKETPVDDEMDVADDERKSEPKRLDEKERALLEKRHALPDTPHLLVHPSKTAKSGKFDCTVMSLSLLLDYRPEDTKEHSFEVSLFAELFNEMLMRDFGFNIVRALNDLPDKPKEEEKRRKRGDDKKKDEDAKDQKSEDGDNKRRHSDDSGNEDDADDKKKKEQQRSQKLYTRDKRLLLSFVYFDQTHCGYIFDKDVEELIYTLGLRMSRAQVKKLIGKVIARDSLHYRKLTDRPREDEEAEPQEPTSETDETTIGNKRLLPVFRDRDGGGATVAQDAGLVTYGGAVVDVEKLLTQLERSEAARLETEARMVDLKSENARLTERYSKSSSAVKHAHSELKEYKEKLRTAEDSLGRANAHSKLFQTTLIDIRDKIDPVLKTVSHKEEKERRDRERDDAKKERDREPRESDKEKSRWEKDVKKEPGDRETAKKETEDGKTARKEEDRKEDDDAKREESK
ncbi:cell division cycle and apoptosis regulator protein 1-like [Cylas formicarius]|uniref:cell division cycle and apoptosis regulator protein 1-like n=1 Tax=Cylas formicarius TaxID=197179 RepID=UPI002958D019|nr:cell division cycle and apoptosis regulator protein 1-like [Cylas formicarius]